MDSIAGLIMNGPAPASSFVQPCEVWQLRRFLICSDNCNRCEHSCIQSPALQLPFIESDIRAAGRVSLDPLHITVCKVLYIMHKLVQTCTHNASKVTCIPVTNSETVETAAE